MMKRNHRMSSWRSTGELWQDALEEDDASPALAHLRMTTVAVCWR